MSRLADPAEDFAVEGQLIDAPGERVSAVQELLTGRVRRRNADGPRRAGLCRRLLCGRRCAHPRLGIGGDRHVDLDLAHERVRLRIDHLDTAVPAIADVNEALRVVRDRMRRVQLAQRRSAPRLADRRDVVAVLGELRDAGVDVAVADVDVALGVPRDVGRLAELTRHGRPRRIHSLPRLGFVRRLFLPSEHQRHAPFRIEADDHVRALVDRPEVVVLVEADRVRVRPGVEALADFANEFAGLVEEQHLRRRRAVRGAAGAVRSREDRDLALRVDGDARRLAEIHAGRQLEEIDVGVERDFRRRLLREERRAEARKRGADDGEQIFLHGLPPGSESCVGAEPAPPDREVYLYRASASDAYAVAASLMNFPASDAGSRCLLSDAARHMPVAGS